MGAAVTLTNADGAGLPVSAAVLSRSEYDDRIQVADNSAADAVGQRRRSMNRFARAWELSRSSVGGTVVALPALTNGGDPNSSIVAHQRGGRAPRHETDRHARRADVDRHQAGRHVDPLPDVDAAASAAACRCRSDW